MSAVPGIPLDEAERQGKRLRKTNGHAHGSAAHSGNDDVAKPEQRVSGYEMKADGLYHKDDSEESPGGIKLSGRFDVLATSRDEHGNSWGIWLTWKDPDGRNHQWAMPRSLLVGDGIECLKGLVDRGLFVATGRRSRERLLTYLMAVNVSKRVRAVSKNGWHDGTFVLPGENFGPAGAEECLLQSTGRTEHRFEQAGTLDSWRDTVAKPCEGNSRLVVAVSTAFAAPLISLIPGAESGGLHLRGRSSEGKTTALVVAGSVWGGGDKKSGFVRSWHTTSTALEYTATSHNDGLLCLDEIGQCKSRALAQAAYLLGNSQGKGRGTKDAGLLRPQQRWTLLYLSSGEISLSQKLAEDGRGRKAAAGQEVRVVDVPADPGCGLGMFENIHGAEDAKQFAESLIAAACRNYGTPIRAFLRKLADSGRPLIEEIGKRIGEFEAEHSPTGADGQVKRVLKRFALIAVAGELATALGVLPWKAGEAQTAAKKCFDAWLSSRGGVEAGETKDGIAQVRMFFAAHGESRFSSLDDEAAARTTVNRAGFRQKLPDGGIEYYVFREVWEHEVCAGLDMRRTNKDLAAKSLLIKDNDGKYTYRKRLPGTEKPVRCYRIAPAILGGEDET